jgi:hypothetical protein
MDALALTVTTLVLELERIPILLVDFILCAMLSSLHGPWVNERP